MSNFIVASLDKIGFGTAFCYFSLELRTNWLATLSHGLGDRDDDYEYLLRTDWLATLSHGLAEKLVAGAGDRDDDYEYLDECFYNKDDVHRLYPESKYRAVLNLTTGFIMFVAKTAATGKGRGLSKIEHERLNALRQTLRANFGESCGPRLFTFTSTSTDVSPTCISGPAPVAKPPVKAPEKTPEQRFFEDRVRKAREFTAMASKLTEALAAAETRVDSSAQRAPEKTRGDKVVDDARAGSLKQIDDAVTTIEGSAELLRKIGVDAEVKKAIDDGVKAFAPYRRLRKKGK